MLRVFDGSAVSARCAAARPTRSAGRDVAEARLLREVRRAPRRRERDLRSLRDVGPHRRTRAARHRPLPGRWSAGDFAQGRQPAGG